MDQSHRFAFLPAMNNGSFTPQEARLGSEPSTKEIPSRDLGHLNYRRFQPHPLLQPWVQCYWSVRLVTAPEPGYLERMYPDGGVSITFNLLDSGKHWFSAKQSLHTLTVGQPIDSLGIRFHPGGAQWLLQQSLSDIADRHYSLEDFAFPEIDAIVGAVNGTQSVTQRIFIIEQWLLREYRRLQPAINLAQQVAKHWPGSGTELSSWCAKQRLNRRAVERAFRHYLGVAPNQYKILYQVQQARRLIKHTPEVSLATVSQLCNYYDQSHFTHHFRKITGQTPGQYRRRQQQKLAFP